MKTSSKVFVVFFTICLFLISLAFGNNAGIMETTGTLSFSVTTANHGGEYAPKNIIAIWVTTADGTLVKSLKVMAAQRKSKLIKWLAASGGNTVDAVTGPTLTSNQTHSVSWDCTNTSGMVVPDGNYIIHVEFTDNDFQGPIASFDFAKSPSLVHLNPSDLTYFKNISLSFVPDPNTIGNTDVKPKDINVFPNPFSNSTSIRFFISELDMAQFEIFDMAGTSVYRLDRSNFVLGHNSISWNGKDRQGTDLPAGVYFCILKADKKVYHTKIILNR